MDKQRRSRYLIAVYLIVFLVAAIMLLTGLYFVQDTAWQSVWINLSTGMLGVALIFFLVDRFFLADEWKLSDRIEQLVKYLESVDQPSAGKFFTKKPELAPYIQTAKTIRMCGVSLTSTINGNIGFLRDRLAYGATIDLMICDPNSQALKMSALRSEKPDDIDYYSKRIASSFKDISYLWESCQPKPGAVAAMPLPLSVRLLPYAPSFYLCQIVGQDDSEVVFVEIYPHGTANYASPPIFELTPERDGRWYEFFVRQFDNMWQGAKSWEPEPVDTTTQQRNHDRQQAPATDFFMRQRHIPDYLLDQAQVIAMSGYTLSRTPREYLRQLDRCLATGGKIQVMILDSDEALLQECVRRSHGRTTASHWRKRLDSTVSFIEVLASTPDITGSIKLGRLPYLPSFGFIMLDPDTDHGVIIVELYHHRSAEDNPTFELYADRDQEWYRFFRQQFDAMWNSCRLEELAGVSEP